MKNIYLSIFLLIQLISPSQNLVPNPSFENVTSCPTGGNQLNKAFPWCGISSDESLLHACNITLAGSVPFSLTNMFQYPKTGNGFALVGMYNIPPLSYRGYAQVPLIQTLTISKKYIVKFYINLNNDSRYAIDKIGALLANKY